MTGFTQDPELEASTDRVMAWGVVLMAAMVVAFPLYRLVEPTNRKHAREGVERSLAEQGQETWALTCASCHGLNGQGGIAPALNSQQFLQVATRDQIQQFVSVGVPGTQMAAYSLDFGGPLTSEQIRAIATYVRSWEKDAPDRPDWRDPTTTTTTTSRPTTTTRASPTTRPPGR